MDTTVENDWRILGDRQKWLENHGFSFQEYKISDAVVFQDDGVIAARKANDGEHRQEPNQNAQVIEGAWDHEHCYFCWAKLLEGDSAYRTVRMLGEQPQSGDESAVFTQPVQEVWVCQNCFEDFRERFGWKVDQ